MGIAVHASTGSARTGSVRSQYQTRSAGLYWVLVFTFTLRQAQCEREAYGANIKRGQQVCTGCWSSRSCFDRLSTNGDPTSSSVPARDLFGDFLGGVGEDFRQGRVVVGNAHEVLGRGAVVERHDTLVDQLAPFRA